MKEKVVDCIKCELKLNEYLTKIIVAINKDPKKVSEQISGQYLEDNLTFLLFVDITPKEDKEDIEDKMQDYTVIDEVYTNYPGCPGSNRVFRMAFWVGDQISGEDDYFKLDEIVRAHLGGTKSAIEIEVIS